nr:hypothetical protein [Microcella frigidaquae]
MFQGDAGLAATGDPHDVLAELDRIGLGHEVHPSRPPLRASQIRCHLSVHQSLEVARYFAASVEYDEATDRFHISGVMGPDEYHDGYPDAPGAGVRDNTYTNVMVAWVCQRAGEALAELAGHLRDDITDRLGVGHDEIEHWAHVSERLAICVHADGILSQFDGYESLVELDWAGYRERYGNIGRLDLILESENDTTNRYKLAKQPDVVMLVYLLGHDQLRHQLARLGYPCSHDDIVRTVTYYLERTSNGSTLSQVVNASVATSR